MRARVLAVLLLALMVMPLTSCSIPLVGGATDSSLGGDACLLQQYQSHNMSILSHLQDGVGTLTGALDALHGSSGAISPSQDITQTVYAIVDFESLLRAQQALIATGAQPPEAKGYRDDVAAAVGRFDAMSSLLAQAYTDALNGDPRSSADIVEAARALLRQGQTLLNSANEQISNLATFSPNC